VGGVVVFRVLEQTRCWQSSRLSSRSGGALYALIPTYTLTEAHTLTGGLGPKEGLCQSLFWVSGFGLGVMGNASGFMVEDLGLRVQG